MMQEDIRNAILNRNFEEAQRLIEQWGQSVILSLKAASDQAQRETIYNQAIAFADSTTHLSRVVRAHIAAELHANSTLFLYRIPDLEQHRWQLEA